MTTVYIIRHAQAEGNLYRRCHGWYNSLITPKGYRQIEALSERFRDIKIDAVYSSDLYRTMTTAQAICRPHGLPLRLDPDLREIGMGVWEEYTWGDALRENRESMRAFLSCDPSWSLPGSDTFPGAQDRFCNAVERYAKSHPNQTIACFAHGAVIRTAFARWMGLPIDRIAEVPLGGNTCVSCLEIDDGQVHIRFYADVSHLNTPETADPHRSSTGDGLKRLEETTLSFLPLDPRTQFEEYSKLLNVFCSEKQRANAAYRPVPAHQEHSPASDYIRIAYANDVPVGLLHLSCTPNSTSRTRHISSLAVHPDYRRLGFGTQLLGEAIYTSRKAGCDHLRIFLSPEDSSAELFFRQFDFHSVSVEPGNPHILEAYIGIKIL